MLPVPLYLDTSSTDYSLFDALGYINISLDEVDQVFNFSISQADDAGRVTIGGNGTPGSGEKHRFASRITAASCLILHKTLNSPHPALKAIEILTYQTGGGLGLFYPKHHPQWFQHST